MSFPPRQLLGAGGVHGKAFRAAHADWLARGCEVTAQRMVAANYELFTLDTLHRLIRVFQGFTHVNTGGLCE